MVQRLETLCMRHGKAEDTSRETHAERGFLREPFEHESIRGRKKNEFEIDGAAVQFAWQTATSTLSAWLQIGK
jgi:hypothetical protein